MFFEYLCSFLENFFILTKFIIHFKQSPTKSPVFQPLLSIFYFLPIIQIAQKLQARKPFYK